MSDNSLGASDAGSDTTPDTAEQLVDVVADIRRLMAERNRAAEKAHGNDSRRSQWA